MSEEEATSPVMDLSTTWVRGDAIGETANGTLYLGMLAESGDLVTAKCAEILQLEGSSDDEVSTRHIDTLKREGDLLSTLDHKHVVAYKGFEESSSHYTLFYEYVAGGSIQSLIKNYGIFEEPLCKNFAKSVLDGLIYLESKGLVHGNLKSDRVYVDSLGVCKITDFGEAKTLDEIKGPMTHRVPWVAPEAFTDGGYDCKVDVWSVGCLIFEMLVGKYPWNDGEDEIKAVLLSVPEGHPLSSSAHEILKLCFAIDPADRPTASELRKHAWFVSTS